MAARHSEMLKLRCEKVSVGTVTDVLEHQGTWFGTFRQTVSPDVGEIERRLCDFIEFCCEFNRRCGAGMDADATAFDQFRDLFAPGLWHTAAPDGTVNGIVEAPNFSDEEVSWRCA